MSPVVFVLLTWALVATAAAVRFASLAADYAQQAASRAFWDDIADRCAENGSDR